MKREVVSTVSMAPVSSSTRNNNAGLFDLDMEADVPYSISTPRGGESSTR